MGFQTQVNTSPAPAVWGDFASSNPRAVFLAGPGGLVAGAAAVNNPPGVAVGRFAWATPSPADPNGAASIANNTGTGPVTGFVHREQQGLITTFLADSSQIVPTGLPIILHTSGDFWAKNEGTTEALPGQKAYASFANGAVSFAATGSATTTAAAASTVTAQTFSGTGSIVGNTLNVTAVGSGTVVAGGTISGTGVASGTQIVSQLSGTAGGIGTYAVSIPEQNVASTTISGTYGLLTLGGAPSNGNFVVGGTITGTGVAAGTQVTQLISGSGGNGSTFAVNNNTVVGSTSITETLNVETKWIAMSSGLAGELVKISSQPLG